ncbi:hypothetical protein D3C71_1859480 [compost metagenome]
MKKAGYKSGFPILLHFNGVFHVRGGGDDHRHHPNLYLYPCRDACILSIYHFSNDQEELFCNNPHDDGTHGKLSGEFHNILSDIFLCA